MLIHSFNITICTCIVLLLIASGCSFIPLPLTYMSSAKSGIDIVQLLRGEQTINDRIVSSVVEKTCYTIAWLHGKEYCIEIESTQDLPPMD